MKTSVARRGLRLLGAGMVVALAASACIKPPRIEPPSPRHLSQRSRILAADGTVLATLFAENRIPVDYQDVPPHLIDAVLAAEDQRFLSHEGFDGKSIVRAAIRNFATGEIVEGGSTITQQYVKNLYFPVERPKTLEQKIKEAQIAWKLEQEHSKQDILERYLNTVYFGNGAYGVRAAAEEFFSKPVWQLNLVESALLAGLIRAPENDNPRREPGRALMRRNHVLSRMQALGMIAAAESGTASAAALGLRDSPKRPVLEPHFVEYVKQSILADPNFGRDESERATLLYRGGVDIHTSLDLGLQQLAKQAVAENLGRPGDPEAALVALDPKTGKVLAMVGGRDFSISQVNLALGIKGGGSGRQPGSAFKPIVLAAAYEDGIPPNTTYSTSPPRIQVSRTEVWRPQNYDGRGGGRMDLVAATALSVNAVFARLGMDVGPRRVKAMAERMGITAPLEPHPSISLGTMEVSVLDMASAYGTLANYGTHTAADPVVRVDLPGGGRIDPQPKITRAMSPGVAWMVTDALTRVITNGTGTRAQLGRPAAGKTGTTQEIADAWFVGYTPEIVTAVWVGYPSGRVPMRSLRGQRVFGGTFPAAIWKRFMQGALDGRPVSFFDLPRSDLVTLEIDPYTGYIWNPYCSGRQTVQMLRQLAPTSGCPSPPPPPVAPAEPEPEPEPEPPALEATDPPPSEGDDEEPEPGGEPPPESD